MFNRKNIPNRMYSIKKVDPKIKRYSRYFRKRNYFKINKNILEKISSKYSRLWSSFEYLNVRNATVQSKFNLNNWFLK
jgi:hypothetical protein